MTAGEKILSAIVGAFAGILGAMLVVAIHVGGGGISAGDLVQFLGALCGTGLAVAGALWIESWKRRRDRADAAAPILEALINLEDKSRPFFSSPGKRSEHADAIDRKMIVLDNMIGLAPPRSGKIMAWIYELRLAATLLTGDRYLKRDADAPLVPSKERSNIEEKLELFDTPLKLLIIEYSRIVDRRAARSVPHLGPTPEW